MTIVCYLQAHTQGKFGCSNILGWETRANWNNNSYFFNCKKKIKKHNRLSMIGISPKLLVLAMGGFPFDSTMKTLETEQGSWKPVDLKGLRKII